MVCASTWFHRTAVRDPHSTLRSRDAFSRTRATVSPCIGMQPFPFLPPHSLRCLLPWLPGTLDPRTTAAAARTTNSPSSKPQSKRASLDERGGIMRGRRRSWGRREVRPRGSSRLSSDDIRGVEFGRHVGRHVGWQRGAALRALAHELVREAPLPCRHLIQGLVLRSVDGRGRRAR